MHLESTFRAGARLGRLLLLLGFGVCSTSAACGGRTVALASDHDRRIADVRALEARSCPELADDETVSVFGRDLAIDFESSGDEVFATYTGLCQRMVAGAYNPTSAVVHWTDSGIEFARFDTPPSWLPDAEMFSDARTLFHAQLEVVDGRVELRSGMHARGIGDAGFWVRYRWHRDRFVPVELRRRDGGSFLVEDTHPFPIVAPVEVRCSAALILDPRVPGSVTIERSVRADTTRTLVPLSDADCVRSSDDTIACGGESFEPVAEYTVIPSGDDWIVVRVDRETQREVARVARLCALEEERPAPR